MVMLSDSEPNPGEATPVALGDVRDAEDSLLMFSSEGTQPLRPFAEKHVPRAVIDDRAARQAVEKLDEYSDTLARLSALCASIDQRLERAEEMLHRSEGSIANRAVRELSASIDARVMGTDEAVRRIEQVVASRSQEELSTLRALQAAIDTRLLQAEEVLRRTEAQSRSTLSPWLMPLRWQRAMRSLAAAGALVGVSIFVMMMRLPITGERQPVPRAVERSPEVRDGLVEAPAPPVSVPTPPPPRPPAPALGRVAIPTPTAAVARRPFVGDLSIASTPIGARVFINGRAVGVTPLVLHERQAGSVAVQIASEGFERWSAAVQVSAGQTTNVAPTLRRTRP